MALTDGYWRPPVEMWPDTVELLLKLDEPWGEAHVVSDLRWWEDRVRMRPGGYVAPTMRDLSDRWGWSMKRVRKILHDLPRWSVPDNEGQAEAFLDIYRGRAPKRKSASGHAQGTVGARAGHNEGTGDDVIPATCDDAGHNEGTRGEQGGHAQGTYTRGSPPSEDRGQRAEEEAPPQENLPLLENPAPHTPSGYERFLAAYNELSGAVTRSGKPSRMRGGKSWKEAWAKAVTVMAEDGHTEDEVLLGWRFVFTDPDFAWARRGGRRWRKGTEFAHWFLWCGTVETRLNLKTRIEAALDAQQGEVVPAAQSAERDEAVDQWERVLRMASGRKLDGTQGKPLPVVPPDAEPRFLYAAMRAGGSTLLETIRAKRHKQFSVDYQRGQFIRAWLDYQPPTPQQPDLRLVPAQGGTP